METALDNEYLPLLAFRVEEEKVSSGKTGVAPRASGGLPALIKGRSTCNALTFLSETTLVGMSEIRESGTSVSSGN